MERLRELSAATSARLSEAELQQTLWSLWVTEWVCGKGWSFFRVFFALRPHLTPVSWRECLCSPPPLCSPGDRLRFYSYHLTMLNPGSQPCGALVSPHQSLERLACAQSGMDRGLHPDTLSPQKDPTHSSFTSEPPWPRQWHSSDSKSMMELSKIPFPIPVKTQYRSGTR